MDTLVTFVGANWDVMATAALSIIGGASVLAALIAPKTENKVDDKVAAFLGKVHGWVSKIALNPPKQ